MNLRGGDDKSLMVTSTILSRSGYILLSYLVNELKLIHLKAELLASAVNLPLLSRNFNDI